MLKQNPHAKSGILHKLILTKHGSKSSSCPEGNKTTFTANKIFMTWNKIIALIEKLWYWFVTVTCTKILQKA